jgi:hypothetical protein
MAMPPMHVVMDVGHRCHHVVHANGDTLDCRKTNLQVVSYAHPLSIQSQMRIPFKASRCLSGWKRERWREERERPQSADVGNGGTDGAAGG